MTISVVAVCSNVVKNGKPLIGYGFNSNGRYGQGHLIRERFAPRLLKAAAEESSNDKSLENDKIADLPQSCSNASNMLSDSYQNQYKIHSKRIQKSILFHGGLQAQNNNKTILYSIKNEASGHMSLH